MYERRKTDSKISVGRFLIPYFSSVSNNDQLLLANIWCAFQSFGSTLEMNEEICNLQDTVASNVCAMNADPTATLKWPMLPRPYTDVSQLRRAFHPVPTAPTIDGYYASYKIAACFARFLRRDDSLYHLQAGTPLGVIFKAKDGNSWISIQRK